MYTTFIFSFTELTTSIPHAGGPFAYSRHAFGPTGGYIAGAATLIEFVFAPPAIALAIGAYLNVQFPSLDPKVAAVGAYLVFMSLNILGVAIAATFELVVTLVAIFELLVFMGVVVPGFRWRISSRAAGRAGWIQHGRDCRHVRRDSVRDLVLPRASRASPWRRRKRKTPKRSIPIAYIAGILTLVALALGVMLFAGAAGDWTKFANINDPLPQAMKYVVGENSGWLHMLVGFGLFGLVASFHGIIIGYSRQIFAHARAGYLPAVLAKVHPRFKTPHLAILAGGAVGILAIFSDNGIVIGGQPLTANIVTMSVFGAILMYIISMASLFKLRRSEPTMPRPFIAPCYPYFPAIALFASAICMIAMIYYNFLIFAIFVAILALGYVYFLTTVHRREAAPIDALIELTEELKEEGV